MEPHSTDKDDIKLNKVRVGMKKMCEQAEERKIFLLVTIQLQAGPSNWLASLVSCIGLGGTLAKVESQQEQDLAYQLSGTVNPQAL